MSFSLRPPIMYSISRSSRVEGECVHDEVVVLNHQTNGLVRRSLQLQGPELGALHLHQTEGRRPLRGTHRVSSYDGNDARGDHQGKHHHGQRAEDGPVNRGSARAACDPGDRPWVRIRRRPAPRPRPLLPERSRRRSPARRCRSSATVFDVKRFE